MVTVTASVASGAGTVSPGSANIVTGSQAQFTFNPSTGFTAELDPSTTCAGGNLTGNVYTVSNVTSSCNVVARFVAMTYAVTATAAGPGTAAPGAQTVAHGGAAVITLNPTTNGFKASLAPTSTCVGTFNADNTAFTVSNVTANCAAAFSFIPMAPNVAAIPTLSEWALLILGMLMIAAFWLKNRSGSSFSGK
jgi:hypothetical protein